jgi:hypothetical protein
MCKKMMTQVYLYYYVSNYERVFIVLAISFFHVITLRIMWDVAIAISSLIFMG